MGDPQRRWAVGGGEMRVWLVACGVADGVWMWR